VPTPRPVPPTGFLPPSAASAATTSDESELPRSRRCAAATTRSSAALFHAASVPGIRPSELSPPEEPHRLSAAVASLRVRSRPRRPARRPPVRPTAFGRAPRRSRARSPPRGGRPCATTDAGRGFPAIVRPPVHRASCPARRPGDRQETFGLAGTRPFRPLRSLAPPGSPFTRPTARASELAPGGAHGRPGRCSPGFGAPPEPAPPRPRVRSTATTARRTERSRKSEAPPRKVGALASFLRPRPSRNQRCSRMAVRHASPTDAARVRAPSRRRPFLSCPSPSRAAEATRPGRTSEVSRPW